MSPALAGAVTVTGTSADHAGSVQPTADRPDLRRNDTGRSEAGGDGRRLGACDEQRLARLIEAGVFARQALTEGRRPCDSSDEELRLIVAEGEQAWREFFEGNIALVRAVVARWLPRGDPETDDLVHEGCVGLAEAIVRFDFALGWRFSTLAWKLISHHVRRAAVSHHSCGSGTVAHARRVAEIERARDHASSRLGRTVGDHELASLLGRSERSVRRDLLQARRADADLDALEHAGDMRTLPDIDFLEKLSSPEREILIWNFGIGADRRLTLVEIAERLGMSVSAVSRLKKRGLHRGRRLLAEGHAA